MPHTIYNVEPQNYTDNYLSLFELTEFYEKQCEMSCCYGIKSNKVDFCDICDYNKPLHLLDDCIDLYIFRKINKPLRMNENDIFDILKKNCRKIIMFDCKAGFIISSTQKESFDKDYRNLLIKNKIDPDKPFLYRSVTTYNYCNLGNKNESRDSSFVTSEMVFDFIHPKIVNSLIQNNIL